ncbi:MAG TPA: peroxiredoxin [Acidimicrobiales bacterium]|nr:peroxiredoxin [Acidimicrobiales bacterium]
MQNGDLVADFSLPDQFGDAQSLYRYLERGPVVLFFYPAAMTKGCTIECSHFRELKGEFEALGAQRIGISRDAVGKQRKFSDLQGFDYSLLSDSRGIVAEQFRVSRSFALLPVKRRTFVIGGDGRVVGIMKSEVRMNSHADRALDLLRKLVSVK